MANLNMLTAHKERNISPDANGAGYLLGLLRGDRQVQRTAQLSREALACVVHVDGQRHPRHRHHVFRPARNPLLRAIFALDHNRPDFVLQEVQDPAGM
jgi:hypothetical protein